MPASRTPEGAPANCAVCGAEVAIEPSATTGDAPCPSCGSLLWFLRTSDGIRITGQPLVFLQDIDRSIYMLRTERATRPETLDALRADLEAATARRDQAEDELNDLRERQRELDADVAMREDAITALRNRLEQAATEADREAIFNQVESEKLGRRSQEERILETMEQIEVGNAQISEVLAEIARLEERIEDESQEASDLTEEIDDELADLENQRAELLESVPEAAMQEYEQLLEATHGQALAAVEGNTCTGCYSTLPQAVVERVRREQLVLCPSCGRILYL